MNLEQVAVITEEQNRLLEQPAAKPSVRHAYLAYALLGLVMLLTCAIRFHLRTIPLERDEGEYAYSGQLMLQGLPPYKLAYNMKLPGTYAAYALIMGVFGQTTEGIRMGLLVVNLVTIFLVFLLGRRFGGLTVGVTAAATYAMLSVNPTVLGFCGHATHFVVLAALSGILLLLKAMEQDKKFLFFCSGVLLGIGYVMKQPGAVFVLFGALYFLRTEYRPGTKWRALAEPLAFYFAGAALPFLITCLLLWRAGVFSTFWFWTVSYASQYATNNGLTLGAYYFYLTFGRILMSTMGLWLIAGIGVIAVCLDRRSTQRSKFLLGFLVFSFLAVCVTFAFRPHYFILMLPVVSVMAGIAVAATAGRIRELSQKRILQWAPYLLFILALAACFYKQRDFFLETDPNVACRDVYLSEPFPEAVPVADYIRQHTPENSTIAVLGSEPEIYFYAHRHSATGYIYTYGLMEDQKYALKMQAQMIAEVEASRPETLVFVNLYTSWDPNRNTKEVIYEWARKYIQENYDIIGVVDVPMTKTNYRWGSEAKNYNAKPYYAILVFTRKAS
jgi:Dolichyl-phosphate-mannose-protein mannosyltransferase